MSFFSSTTVGFSATPAFPALTQVQLFKMTLTGNVTSSTLTLAGLIAPAFIIFELTQDATGGRTFAWPSNALAAPVINPGANETTSAMFYYDGTNCIAVTPGMVNP
jgi:hypothetical protein